MTAMSYLRWSACYGGFWGVLAAGVLYGADASRFEHIQEHWRWSHFDRSVGLPSEHVAQILGGGDGTVWASTAKGVAWYDGYFWHPARGLEPLPGARLSIGAGRKIFAFQRSCLFEGDSSGFAPAGLCKAEKWFDAAPLDSGESLAVAVDRKPFVFRGEQGQPAGFSSYIESFGVSLFLQTRGRAVWWADRQGLIRRQHGVNRTFFPAPVGRPWEKLGFHLAGLAENARGAGVAAVVHPQQWAGIWGWSPGGQPARIAAAPGLEDAQALDIADSGEIVLVQRSGHVWRRSAGGEWLAVTLLPQGFRQVTRVHFDGAGNLWLATETGVHLFRASQAGWKVWAHPVPDRRNSVNGLMEARDGTVWIANGAGVEQVRVEADRLVHLASYPLGLSTGVGQDREGNIWASSGLAYGGAWRWDGKTWRRFGRAEGLTDNRVHRVNRDRFGRIWFTVMEGLAGDRPEEAGAYLLLSNGSFEHWVVGKNRLSNRVFSVDTAPDGGVYLAAVGGLSRFRNDKWTHWIGGKELASQNPFSVVVANDGTPYWADRANGVGTIDSQDRPRYWTESDGVLSNSIWELHLDRQGELWAAGRGGVSVLRAGEWLRYGTEHGLPVEQVWPIVRTGSRICVVA